MAFNEIRDDYEHEVWENLRGCIGLTAEALYDRREDAHVEAWACDPLVYPEDLEGGV